MSSERAIGRYRRWYSRLLRLYPRPFRQRFAEPMAQTFTDLIRDRREADRGLLGFALGTFAETSAGIMRENVTQLMQTRNYLRWVLITLTLLAIPYLAMVFQIGIPDPGSGTERVNWGPMDFALMGVLILGSGLLFEYASSRGGSTAHKAAVGIAVVAGLGLIWVNLAVGMIGDEGNPANLMYLFVIFVALFGAAISRFEPSQASLAMFAAAGTQVAVAVIALIAGLGPTLLADAFFAAAWVASGLLFRHASMERSPAG
jgi:MFS family permease